MKTIFLPLIAVFAVLLPGCGDDDASTATPTFKMVGSAGTAASTVLRTPTLPNFLSSLLRGTESCGGGSSTCCTSGTGCHPTTLTGTFYKVWISTNADCSSATLITDNGTSPTAQNFFESPTLFSGTPAAGSYSCVILKQNDVLSFIPNSTAAGLFSGCDSGTSYDFDVFRSDNGSDSWYDYDNSTTMTGEGSVASPTAQQVSIYISTDSSAVTSANSNVSTNQIVTLSSAFTVTAGTTKTLVLTNDFGDKVYHQDNTTCWLNAPTTTISEQSTRLTN